jgi:hypothetical protein
LVSEITATLFVLFFLERDRAGEGIQDVPRGLQREEQREGYARQQAHGGTPISITNNLRALHFPRTVSVGVNFFKKMEKKNVSQAQ